jgi:hypothetical protein
MTKTKIALATLLLTSMASAAFAEDGMRTKSNKRAVTNASMAQAVAKRVTPAVDASMPGANLMINVMDRASSPFACGG